MTAGLDVFSRARFGIRSTWICALFATSVLGCGVDSSFGAVDVHEIVISPATLSIAQGDQAQLIADVLDRYGVTFAGVGVAWLSQNSDVVAVSSAGVVTAVTAGTTFVSASADGVTGQAEITVTAPPVLQLSQSTLGFAGTAGGADPADQDITITNGGGGGIANLVVGSVTYGSAQPTGWLTVLADESTLVLTVRTSIAGLAVGSYSASFDLRADSAAPVTLTVTLTVS